MRAPCLLALLAGCSEYDVTKVPDRAEDSATDTPPVDTGFDSAVVEDPTCDAFLAPPAPSVPVDPACLNEPVPGTLDPVVEWTTEGTIEFATEPTYKHPYVMPAVGNRNRRSAMCLKLRGVAAACERPILAAIKAAWTSRHCSRATAGRRSRCCHVACSGWRPRSSSLARCPGRAGWASRMSPTPGQNCLRCWSPTVCSPPCDRLAAELALAIDALARARGHADHEAARAADLQHQLEQQSAAPRPGKDLREEFKKVLAATRKLLGVADDDPRHFGELIFSTVSALKEQTARADNAQQGLHRVLADLATADEKIAALQASSTYAGPGCSGLRLVTSSSTGRLEPLTPGARSRQGAPGRPASSASYPAPKVRAGEMIIETKLGKKR